MAEGFFCKDCDLWKTSCGGPTGQDKLNCIQGVGNKNARIMIVGMCPGSDECQTKIPFTGDSGQKLRDCIKAAGLKLEDVYITNLVRCRPPRVKKAAGGYEDREPLMREVKACKKYLDEEIAEVGPRVLVLLGNTVCKSIIGKTGITQIHGASYWNEYYGTTCIPAYHPSYVIRRPDEVKLEIDLVEDLKFAKKAAETEGFTEKPKMKTNYIICDTIEKFDKFIQRLQTVDEFVNDIETTSLNSREGKMLCTAFSWKEGTGVAVPLRKWFRYYNPSHTGLGEPIYEERKKPKKKEAGEGEFVQNIQLSDSVDLKEKKSCNYKLIGEMVYELEDYWTPEEMEYIKSKLTPILEDRRKKKIGHNLAFDVCFTNDEWEIEIKGAYYDTMYGDYLPDPEKPLSRKLEDLAWIYTDMGGYDEGLKKERESSFRNVEESDLYKYACADCDCTYRIYKKQKEQMKPFMDLMVHILVPLSITVREMENYGIKIDLKHAERLSKKYEENIKKLEAKLYNLEDVKKYMAIREDKEKEELVKKWNNSPFLKKRYTSAGYVAKNLKRFNFGSTRDLRDLLFNYLELPTGKTTKTGLASTDEKTLEGLRGKHLVVDSLLELRHLNKIYSTYLKPLPDLVDVNGRLHTNYRLDRTATGRLASNKPNLQNIPKKKDGNDIRDYFEASEGNVLIESDLKQIEYRVLAHFVNDEKMLADIDAGLDIHRLIASEIYNIPEEEVTDEQRSKSKAVTFGVPYGRSSMSLAAEYGMTLEEAEDFRRALLNRYPKVQKWIDNMIRIASEKGYVKTYFGRIRYLPKINDKNEKVREAEIRKIVATAVQGTASDILSIYTININKRLKEMGSKTKLVLTVHDALFFDTPREEVKEIIPIIQEEMERPIKGIRVKIETEVKLGNKWGSLVKHEEETTKEKKEKINSSSLENFG